MMNFIVVGANYGDEGKGLMTDFLCHREKADRCIRFNGGAQAGHTVHRDGKTHIFSSFGSGTLAGTATELTSQVIINAHAALKEADVLVEYSRIGISKASPITTPFEIALNQAIELRRGNARHGSCGLGINETVERHLAMPEDLRESFFSGEEDGMNWIREEWIPRRMTAHGFSVDEILSMQQRGNGFAAAFHATMADALEQVFKFDIEPAAARVYEGAQGLGLDEYNLSAFPFVTRSNTGIFNALVHLRSQNRQPQNITPIYVSRAYLTRHGAGPLAKEMSDSEVLCGQRAVDTTNITNQWQGSMRFAPLNIPDLIDRIDADVTRNQSLCEMNIFHMNPPQLALTCLDQSTDMLVVRRRNGEPVKTKTEDISKIIEGDFGIKVGFKSYGVNKVEQNG